MAGKNLNENLDKYFELVVKAWDDKELKKELLKNPTEVLARFGVKLPENTKVKITQGADKVSWDFKNRKLTLPFIEKPEGLSDTNIADSSAQSVDCFSKIDCFSAMGV